MSIKKRLSDAALFGFGTAAGQALFDRAKRELFGDEEDEEALDPKEKEKRAKAAAKEAERLAKEEAKQRAREAEEKRKAKAKLERDVDDELAALKKKLRK
jgi:hypothetical protein